MAMAFLGLFAAPSVPWQAPGAVYEFFQSPLQALLRPLHRFLVVHRRGMGPQEDGIRVVCISDTHTNKLDVPPGDVLIHAGDLTNEGTVSELQEQIDWLASLPHRHVLFIAGNHDGYFDPRSRKPIDHGRSLDFRRLHYLQHSELVLHFPEKAGRSVKFYGAPQIPRCGGDEHAFQYDREEDAWSGTIPSDTDVLITHTPPRWHMDNPTGLGCDFLLEEVWKLRPQLHVFGHVHAGRGMEVVYWSEGQRAFERLAASRGWACVINPFAWMDVARVLIHDVVGIFWTRFFGGESEHTIMLNSGVVNFYNQRVHEAQWVDI